MRKARRILQDGPGCRETIKRDKKQTSTDRPPLDVTKFYMSKIQDVKEDNEYFFIKNKDELMQYLVNPDASKCLTMSVAI